MANCVCGKVPCLNYWEHKVGDLEIKLDASKARVKELEDFVCTNSVGCRHCKIVNLEAKNAKLREALKMVEDALLNERWPGTAVPVAIELAKRIQKVTSRVSEGKGDKNG